MPVPTGATFLGVAKEATRGTYLAPTDYVPIDRNADSPNDMPHTVPDTNLRGSAVESYGETATQIWAEPSYSGNVFVDSIGFWLKCLLGDETLTGSGAPYSHAFSVLNSGNFQPPSLSLTDYNGDVAKGIPGVLVSSLTLKWAATGLLTWDGKFTGFQSATQSTPTPSFGSEPAKPGFQAATTLGGTATSALEEGELTITRKVDVIPTANGTQTPYAIWGDVVDVKGKATLVYEAALFASEYAKLTGSVATSLVFDWTSGSGAAVREIKAQLSKILYTALKPTRGKTYVEIPIEFSGKGNSTDAGASGGYSPIKVTLQNARSTVY